MRLPVAVLLTVALFLLISTAVKADLTDIYDADNCGMPTKDFPPETRRKREIGSVEMNEKKVRKRDVNGNAAEYDYDDDEVDYRDNEGDDETLTDKAMGGTDAALGEIPWAVLIEIDVNGDTAQCGGTLISKRHVITAAHCFWVDTDGDGHSSRCTTQQMMSSEELIKSTTVTVGGVCTEKSKDCVANMLGKKLRIKRAEHYDQFYNGGCREGRDIALLELEQNVPDHVNHACLSHKHNFDQYDSETAVLHSFGYGGDPLNGLTRTSRLQKVELGVAVKPETCREPFGSSLPDIMCTKEEATKNVCAGDSGGGITTKLDGRHYLIGIISFGSDCDSLLQNIRTNKAQVNTDVNYHTSMIDIFIGLPVPDYSEEWSTYQQ